ncbi:hypothetical protein EYF80_012626 [Liparis tanakae]|uniref:Uncharacterized protein n=1 Tax=Liparis tanakae TaxID=230148 RepID=A0A4Z2IH80_9TELE|nr:hypothetical protein EYF80_012626 [Liparis tanakae]
MEALELSGWRPVGRGKLADGATSISQLATEAGLKRSGTLKVAAVSQEVLLNSLRSFLARGQRPFELHSQLGPLFSQLLHIPVKANLSLEGTRWNFDAGVDVRGVEDGKRQATSSKARLDAEPLLCSPLSHFHSLLLPYGCSVSCRLIANRPGAGAN